MAYKPKKKPKPSDEEQFKADLEAFACLLYDIWQEKKLKERKAKEDSNDQRK